MITQQDILKQQKDALNELIEMYGGQSQLGRTLGLDRQVVNNWVKRGRISATYAIKAEQLTGGTIRKEYLRPDVRNWRV